MSSGHAEGALFPGEGGRSIAEPPDRLAAGKAGEVGIGEYGFQLGEGRGVERGQDSGEWCLRVQLGGGLHRLQQEFGLARQFVEVDQFGQRWRLAGRVGQKRFEVAQHVEQR